MNRITLNKAIKHLKTDNKLKKIIQKYPVPNFSHNTNYFDALSKSIIYQQLSGKVARIIYNRFLNLFPAKNPDPNYYLDINGSDLKKIGLSKQKINYINNLSIFFINNKDEHLFNNLSEQEIHDKLIIIKGIGKWTIDMFMMFTLYKTDILPVGDLGIKKAFKNLYNLQKLPSEAFMNQKSNNWKPYRTIASCYLWMIIDDENVW